MLETMRRAHDHKGAAVVEIFQNCNVFNDGAFEKVTGKEVRSDMLIPLRHGEPIRFGADGDKCVVAEQDGRLRVTDVAEVGEDRVLVHDESRDDPGLGLRARRGCRVARTSRRRSASSAPSSARVRRRGRPSAGGRRSRRRATATSPRCSAAARPGTSAEHSTEHPARVPAVHVAEERRVDVVPEQLLQPGRQGAGDRRGRRRGCGSPAAAATTRRTRG